MVQVSHIERDIHGLSAKPRNSRENPEQHANAADFIAQEFETIGLEVSRQRFEIPQQSPPRTGINVVGTLNPSAGTSPILIGAHYDTVPGSPGADDNASGVAAMLECARVLAGSNSSRHVNFVAFDAEEMQPPLEGLHGSTAYVASLTSEHRPSTAIILETIGFSSTELPQRLPGSFRILFRRAYKTLKQQEFAANSLLILSKGQGRHTARMLEKSAGSAGINLPILPLEIPWWMPLVRNLRRSDHAPFWKAGIPAVMISDTANFRNPNYHTPNDTPETLDANLVASAARMVLDAINNRTI
jgi:Zn-dependent M28 family amino/carboxypeptidase